MDLFGIRLVGVNAVTGQKLLLTLFSVGIVLLLRAALNRLTFWLLKRRRNERLDPERVGASLERWREFLSLGKRKGEVLIRRPDGQTRILEYNATARFQPGLHLSSLRDVTERSRLEEALRESERRYKYLFEHNPRPMLIAEVTERFASHFRAERSELRIDAEPGLIGHWDRYRIEQVITNLVTNAIKYGNRNPVEVSLRSEADRALISVRDHGLGIAPQDVDRIFERFERAVPSKHISGLGLGLYISKHVVHAHDGRIRVESTPGKGSEFIVSLPLA